MGRRRRILVVAWAVAAILGVGVGCSKRSEPSCACEDTKTTAPVDSALMAYLSKARAKHHQADIQESLGDIQGASKHLEELLETRLPGQPVYAEAKEVHADARARMAELKSKQSDFDGAEREVEAGLAVAPSKSYFEGHLYEQRGVNEERRSKVLQERGDKKGAEEAVGRALRAFERAVQIQEAVIDRALVDGGTER